MITKICFLEQPGRRSPDSVIPLIVRRLGIVHLHVIRESTLKQDIAALVNPSKNIRNG